MITGVKLLAENRFGLVEVVTQYRSVEDQPTLQVFDFNGAGYPLEAA